MCAAMAKGEVIMGSVVVQLSEVRIRREWYSSFQNIVLFDFWPEYKCDLRIHHPIKTQVEPQFCINLIKATNEL